MNIAHYLDATYLKTAEQAGITLEETKQNVTTLVKEAILNDFKLVMIRAEYVSHAKKLIRDANSNVLVGTVVGFYEGTTPVDEKIEEATKAIANNVDELDYVVNYKAFKKKQVNLVKAEVYMGTKIALENNKVAKWIIEIAALTTEEIISITQLIRDTVVANFDKEKVKNVFVKSSTGFYKTLHDKPNGATFEAMKAIVENAYPLKAKAAGGVRNYEDALKMIKLGVTRIGTSSPKKIIEGKTIEQY